TFGRKRERLRVLRKRRRGAAVKVSRHLVEQQNQREPPFREIGPCVELAARGQASRRSEAGGDLRVYGRIGLEPAVESLLEVFSAARLRLEPEAEQRLDSFVHRPSSAYLTLCRPQRQEQGGAASADAAAARAYNRRRASPWRATTVLHRGRRMTRNDGSKMRGAGLAAAVLVLASLLAACVAAPRTLEAPEVDLVGLALLDGSADAQRFRIGLRVTNPNDVRVSVQRLSFNVRLAG